MVYHIADAINFDDRFNHIRIEGVAIRFYFPVFALHFSFPNSSQIPHHGASRVGGLLIALDVAWSLSIANWLLGFETCCDRDL